MGLIEEFGDLKNIFRGVVFKFRGYYFYYKIVNVKKKKSKRESYINL